ncbi:MAG: hypothetical protein AAF573_21400 [Bacteroidota bacterium]
MMKSIISLFLLVFLFTSCKPTEKIFSVEKTKEVRNEILENPKKYLNQKLEVLLQDFKTSYTTKDFKTRRHFVLTGVNLYFEDSVKITVYFDWKNSQFNYGGGLLNNNEWDFESLKKEIILRIEIEKNSEKIYTIG